MRVLILISRPTLRQPSTGALMEELRRRDHQPSVHDPSVQDPGGSPSESEALAEHRRAPFPWILLEARPGAAAWLRALRRAEKLRHAWVQVLVAEGPQAPGELPELEELLEAGADDLLVPAEGSLPLRLSMAERRAQLGSQGWGSEWTFRHLVETMNEGLGVRDGDGTILYANRRLSEMLGFEPGEMEGLKVTDLVPEGEEGYFEERLARRELGDAETYELPMRTRDGRTLITQQSGQPLTGPRGEPLGSFAVITDVTERSRRERWLRLTQATVDHAADAVFWITREARFCYVNHTACEALGYSREELLEMSVHDIDPDYPPEVWEATWDEVLEGGSFTRESRHRRKDGEIFPVELRVMGVRHGDRAYHVAVARDITERKRTEEMLRYNAFHDALTGLPNRILFMDRLQHCMDRNRRLEGTRFAVLFLDLDRFKVVNDSLGHVVGDELLATLASRLSSALRAVDTVARIGGDEFLVLVEDLESPADAEALAERLQEDLRRPFHVRGHEIVTSASVGIALGEDRYRWAVEILRDADIAMYRSKKRGGACTTLFDREMHRRAVSRMELESDLRRALREGQLCLHHQPILDLSSGQLRAFESLLRWHHPGRGLLLPEEFLVAAEETDLIFPVTWWVLDQACRWVGCLARRGFPQLRSAVNLSSRAVGHGELLERLDRALEEHGVEPESLVLEITESVILRERGRAREVLAQLADRGFGLAIDDFGAGYSSLRYLSHLPVEQVKIDRSFVGRITDEPKSLEITRSVVSLVHKLGLEAVAEGVESEGQLSLLREMGCDLVQGFLLGRPMEEAGALEWLRDAAGPDRRAVQAR